MWPVALGGLPLALLPSGEEQTGQAGSGRGRVGSWPPKLPSQSLRTCGPNPPRPWHTRPFTCAPPPPTLSSAGSPDHLPLSDLLPSRLFPLQHASRAAWVSYDALALPGGHRQATCSHKLTHIGDRGVCCHVTCVLVYICTCVYITCICVYLLVCVPVLCLCQFLVLLYVYLYLCFVCICICIYRSVCVFWCVCVCVCAYACVYTDVYVCACICMYVHVCLFVCLCGPVV